MIVQLNWCPCNNFLVKLFGFMGDGAAGDSWSIRTRENRTSNGDWKSDVQSPVIRNDVLFSMTVYCGSFQYSLSVI